MYGTETVAGNIGDLGLDAHTCCGPGFSSVFSAPSDPGQTKQREVLIVTELLGQSPIHGDPLSLLEKSLLLFVFQVSDSNVPPSESTSPGLYSPPPL